MAGRPRAVAAAARHVDAAVAIDAGARSPPESVMAACALLEVEELFAIGGAQAIAAMALTRGGARAVPVVEDAADADVLRGGAAVKTIWTNMRSNG